MQWAALARSNFAPFVLLKWTPPPPTSLYNNAASSPSVTGLVWALDVCLLATGWPPLCVCGSLLQASNALPLNTHTALQQHPHLVLWPLLSRFNVAILGPERLLDVPCVVVWYLNYKTEFILAFWVKWAEVMHLMGHILFSAMEMGYFIIAQLSFMYFSFTFLKSDFFFFPEKLIWFSLLLSKAPFSVI